MADFSAALFLSTSWKKNSYGPPTWQLISDFCEEALKKKPDELSAIYCTVLDIEVSEEQKEDAARHGVTLILATRNKFVDPDEDPPGVHWLINHNNYYKELDELKDVGQVVGLSDKTYNAASIIHRILFPSAEIHQVLQKPTALFIAHDWNNDELGLTGFHRNLVQDFCERKSKAGEVLKAFSTVLDVKISDDKKKDAESCGVTLIPAQRRLGIEPKADPPRPDWLLNHESYYPDLKELENVQYVVGYAPKTGHAAAHIRAMLFRQAKLVLINHACPESACLEAEEYGLLEFEEKMLEMASAADLVVSIGPVIYDFFQNAYRAEFHGKDLSEIPHVEILPIPPTCFRGRDPVLRETTTHGILTCGQVDTQKAIERCETMAVSIGTAANCLTGSQSPINPPSWKIQGVSQHADQTVVKFLVHKMQCPHIRPTLHPGHSAKSLHRSLQQSHLCLPAPWYSDYSFYGFEAMVSGLPTAAYKYTHLARFIEKYLEEHADQVVVEAAEAKLSERIIKHLQQTALAFTKAKALKTDLVNSEIISESIARFASLLTTTVKQQTGASHSTDQGVKGDVEGVSKTDNPSEKPDEMSIKQQQTVSENKGNDCLTVQIGLDENVQALPAQVRQELMEEVVMTLKAALKRRVEDILGDQDGSQKIRNTCKQKLGDVDSSSMTAKSLAILLRFLTLYNLYRLKQTCRSGSLARAFDPLLITDEMRKIAAKFGITLRLKATYDEKKFEEVELFFINRDGGGIKPMVTYNDVPAVDTDPLHLMILKLDPVHEIHQPTETNVCSLFKAGEYIRRKGSQFDIIQVVMTMTDRIQHILSSRQEILSLLSVTRYLVTDVTYQSLTFLELDEQLTQHGTLIPPITVINETLSLQARSLLPLQTSEQQQLTDSDIRYLALAEPTVQSLQSQLDIALKEKFKLQTALTEKEYQLDIALNEKSQYEKQYRIAEKKVTSKLSEIHNLKEKLKTELEKKELRTKLEQVSDEQSDIELQKKVAESLQLGENVIVSETEHKDIEKWELQPEMTDGVDNGMERAKPKQPKKTITNESEAKTVTPTQPEMTGRDRSEMETATPTQLVMAGRDRSEMETSTPTQPVMTGREGSEMETATPTQPEMTGREKSEMETATPTQPEMTGREGSEMETATPTQPEMTGREGSEMQTAMVTMKLKHQKASCQPDLRLPSSPDDCGHFHLPLLLLSKDIDKRSLNARYDSLTKQLENEAGYFCHGLSNMLGLLEFQNGETVKACQTFKEIFEKDPTNLNALSNLTTVYERMNRKRKAKDYRDKLTEVFEDKGRTFREYRLAALLRCVAEQAFSLAFDCYDEKTRMPPKYGEAISMYKLVLKESENVAAVDGERFKWKMCMLVIRYNKLSKDWQLGNKSEREDREATKEVIALLQILKDILDNCGDGFYQSQCWCYIGMLLIKGRHLMDARSHPENHEKLRQLDLVKYYERPTLCFEDADRCYDGGWKELVKFAKFLIEDKQYENAIQVIEKSLAKNPDKSNWHTYEQRANIYMKMYDEVSQRIGRQGGVPDKTLLRKAEADLELCLEVMDYSPTILLQMARLQIRLCQNPKRWFDYELEDRNALEKAFKILAKIKNTGDIDKYTYAKYLGTNGDCLMYDKEYSDAAAKYEEAILCHGGHYSNFSALLNALFHRLRQQRQSSILDIEDLADIVMKIQKYHGLYEKEYIYKTFKKLSRTFHEEFSDVDNYSFTKTGMKLHEIIEHSSAGESQVKQYKVM